MTTIKDFSDAIKQERQRLGNQRRSQAWDDFPNAARLAAVNSMQLLRHSETHYQLKHRAGWMIDLYPGNQRIYNPVRKDRPRGPFIKVNRGVNWTLTDIVIALVRGLGEGTANAE